MIADELDLRRLAVAMIRQALNDAQFRPSAPGPGTRAKIAARAVQQERRIRARDSARRFLAGGPQLDLWCALAGIHPSRVQAFVASGRRFRMRRETVRRPSRKRAA